MSCCQQPFLKVNSIVKKNSLYHRHSAKDLKISKEFDATKNNSGKKRVCRVGNLTDKCCNFSIEFLCSFSIESELCQKGFVLKTIKDDQEIKYIIYSKNFCRYLHM